MKLCKKCGSYERNPSGDCRACAKVRNAARKPASGEKLEKIREYKRAWHIVNQEKIRERVAQWRIDNPDRDKANHAAWKQANQHKLLGLK